MPQRDSILLVDDDQGFLQIASIILKRKGFEVTAASTASQALSSAREKFYNVSILDISLPDREGTELLSELLKINPDIVPIMLTGHSSVQNTVKSLNLGAFAYLEKPLDPDHLLSVIMRGLDKQRLVLDNRRLLAELEKHGREKGILLSIAQSVSQSLDLNNILELALKKITESIDVDAICVHIVENGSLVMEGCCGFNPNMMEGLKRLEIGEGILQKICRRLELVAIEHVQGTPEPVVSLLGRGGYHSYCGIPLAIAGTAVGVLGVATRKATSSAAWDIDLLTAIGREIAIAVRNAQLYEEASSARALRDLDALRTELLANVSHELRTPLAAIKGFASSLLQPDICFDEETRRSFLQTIDKEADKLNHLIEQLLTMSRIEARTFEISKDRHSLNRIVDAARDSLYSLTLKHRLKIEVPENLPDLLVDGGRMGQVITNLIDNAAKYSPEGSEIRLEAHNAGNEVVVSVSDQGPGIPAEFQPRLFQRFCRLPNDGSAARSGAGLGLSICRGIVEKHGGRIWVESEPGAGTRFSFSVSIN